MEKSSLLGGILNSTNLPNDSNVVFQEEFKLLIKSSSTDAMPVRDLTQQVVVPFIYILIITVGVIGNGIVLYIMKTMVNSKSVADEYVSNLAVADLLLLSTMPFWTIDLAMAEWIFGVFLCKVVSCVTYLNLYASIFFLTSMSLDRWCAVVKAVQCREYRNMKNGRRICKLVWLIALSFMVFPLMYRSTTTTSNGRERCSWIFPPHHHVTLNVVYWMLRSGFGFFLPLTIILFSYCDLILYIHKRSHEKKRKKEHEKLTSIILVVISCFIICWMPNMITNFVILLKTSHVIDCDDQSNRFEQNHEEFIWSFNASTTQGSTTNQTIQTVNSSLESITNAVESEGTFLTQTYRQPSMWSHSFVCSQRLFDLHFFTVCLGFSNSMINPIVYSFMGTKFQKKLKLLFMRNSGQSSNCSRRPSESFWTTVKYSSVRKRMSTRRGKCMTCTDIVLAKVPNRKTLPNEENQIKLKRAPEKLGFGKRKSEKHEVVEKDLKEEDPKIYLD